MLSHERPPDEQIARWKSDLTEQGYCVVPDALPSAAVDELAATLDRVAAEEIANDTDYVYENGSNQRIWVLLNKGAVFEELVEHPLALELIGHLLGPSFLLSNTNANIAGPGGKPMFLHSDQDYVPAPFPPYALVSNVMWCLDEFTAENGATRIVPMSHTRLRPPNYGKQYESVPLTAPRGGMIVIHGALWHQTGANTTADVRRRGILCYYCRPFMRQQENFFKSLAPDVLARATPRLRQLLGYEMWLGGVGAIGGLPRTGPRF